LIITTYTHELKFPFRGFGVY